MLQAACDAVLNRSRWGQATLLAAFGAFAALGQAPFDLWFATVLGLALVFAILRRASGAKQAFGLTLAAGMGYFAVALLWIVEPFFVDVAKHGWMAPFALLGVSLGFGLFWGVAGWITFALRGQAVAFICAFVLVEAVRGYALTGFPWAQLGHVLIDTHALYFSSLAGSLGLTALTVTMSVGLFHILNQAVLQGGAILVSAAACFALAWASDADHASREDTPRPVIRFVHTNEPQQDRWNPDKIPENFQRKLAFTAGEADAPLPDLIVWPETSIPVLLERADLALSAIADDAQGVPVIAGLQRFDGDDFYNSLIHLDGTGHVADIYDKHHLVPFGEYVPFGDTLAKIGIFGLADTTGGGYAAGPGPQVLDLGKLGKALPLICYEGVFPQDVGGYETRPDFLLLITNDAWFGEFSGPYQHLAQARLRSAEQGLPMIRVANTGISAMIDAYGQITQSKGLSEAGTLDAPLPPPRAKTLYAKLGDLPFVVLAVLLLAGGFWRSRVSS